MKSSISIADCRIQKCTYNNISKFAKNKILAGKPGKYFGIVEHKVSQVSHAQNDEYYSDSNKPLSVSWVCLFCWKCDVISCKKHRHFRQDEKFYEISPVPQSYNNSVHTTVFKIFSIQPQLKIQFKTFLVSLQKLAI